LWKLREREREGKERETGEKRMKKKGLKCVIANFHVTVAKWIEMLYFEAFDKVAHNNYI